MGGYSILIRHSLNLCRRFGAAIQSAMLRLSKAGTGCVMTERLHKDLQADSKPNRLNNSFLNDGSSLKIKS